MHSDGLKVYSFIENSIEKIPVKDNLPDLPVKLFKVGQEPRLRLGCLPAVGKERYVSFKK